MNPLHLTLLKLLIMGMIGVPLALLLDPDRRFFYLTGGSSYEFIPVAYLWALYGFVVLVGIYFLTGMGRLVAAYQDRSIVPVRRARLETAWLASFTAALGCTFILFAQSGFTHPALTTLGMSAHEIAVRRIEASQAINGSVYNLGLHVFTAFALAVALFFLRSVWMTVLSLILLVVLATFSLAKSPMADALVELAFVYLLIRRSSWRAVPMLAGVAVVLLAVMTFLTGFATNLPGFVLTTVLRIVWGPFADLPHYFNRFAHDHIGLTPLLPPYVQRLFGANEPSAARLVMEFSNPIAVREGSAGVANTLYVGEAYAVGGVLGILIAPFVAGAMFLVVIKTFGRLRKNVGTVFVFGYLLDRLTVGLFAGISSFMLSGIHIVLGGVLALALVWLAIPPSQTAADEAGYVGAG